MMMIKDMVSLLDDLKKEVECSEMSVEIRGGFIYFTFRWKDGIQCKRCFTFREITEFDEDYSDELANMMTLEAREQHAQYFRDKPDEKDVDTRSRNRKVNS